MQGITKRLPDLSMILRMPQDYKPAVLSPRSFPKPNRNPANADAIQPMRTGHLVAVYKKVL